MESIAFESFIADTLEGAVRVDAVCIRVTTSILPQAFVHIFAGDTIAVETLSAGAAIGPVQVGAVCKLVAVVAPVCAFIVVSAVDLALLDRVANLTATDVRTEGILTASVSTQPWIGLAFVVVDAAFAIRVRKEPLRASADVVSRKVAALAAVTNVGVRLALVDISTADSIW